MPITPDELHFGQFGNVYVGPIGTPLPTNATGALNSALTSLGYIDENGVSQTPTVGSTPHRMWQSATPVKTSLDTIEYEVSFVMGQVNYTTWGLYFFNETFEDNAGEAALHVSSNPGTQERALVIEWEDELGQQSRVCIPRAFLSNREALQLQRTALMTTGVTFVAMDDGGDFIDVYSEIPELNPGS